MRTALMVAALAASSPTVLDRAAGTPDLMQSLPAAGLPDGGQAYCGPVAATNGLVWLARHGHPTLAPVVDDPAVLGAMAHVLGGKRYMHTTLRDGTSKERLLAGLEAYVRSHQVPAKLQYQGVEGVAKRFQAGRPGQAPDPRWVLDRFAAGGMALLLVTWHHRDPQTDTYTSYAGHWLTVVGYGRDAHGRPDPLRPIVHDPAPRSGPKASHDAMTLTALATGRVKTWDDPPFRPAVGRHRVGGGLHLKDGADAGLLEAAVVLSLAKP